MWRKGPYMTFHLGTGPAFVVRLRCIIKARQVLICQVSGRISDISGWLQRLSQFNPGGPSSWPKGLGTWGTHVASQNLYMSCIPTGDVGHLNFSRTFEDCKGFQWDIEEMPGCCRCLTYWYLVVLERLMKPRATWCNYNWTLWGSTGRNRWMNAGNLDLPCGHVGRWAWGGSFIILDSSLRCCVRISLLWHSYGKMQRLTYR